MSGFHGSKARGTYPSDALVQGWCRVAGNREANVALRPAENIVGIDVDAYDGKHGEATLDEAARRWGTLPATWRSTSRPEDPVSGISWFRVPDGLRWLDVKRALNRADDLKANAAGAWADVETIWWGNRYGVVWPSTHPEGRRYVWFDPSGEVADRVPRPDELPHLPGPWVAGLSLEEPAEPTPRATEAASHSPARPQEFAPNQTEWVARGIEGRLADIVKAAGSRNDALNEHGLRVWRLWLTGASGFTAVEVEQLLVDAVTATGYVASDGEEAAFKTIRSAKEGAMKHGPAEDFPEADIGFDPEDVVPGPASGRIHVATLPEPAEWIWGSRPSLAHVRQVALARGVAPLPLLGVMVAHALASVPPFVVLPAIIGSHASLNTFVALVGWSGTGKGAAEGAAEDLLELEAVGYEKTSPGSGEGLTRAFARFSKESPTGLEWLTDRVLMTLAEVDALTALSKRMGATLAAMLRTAWSGEQLGNRYADREKAIVLPKHSYRLTFVMGVQPERAGDLLADSGGGTPQRFVWLPTVNPTYEAAVHMATPDPPPLRVPDAWNTFSGEVGQAKHIIDIPPEAREVILANHEQRQRTGRSDLDGHGLLSRLKFAFGLAVLDSRTAINDADWAIAGSIMAVSDRTRAWVQQELEDEQHRNAERVGRLRATSADAEQAGRGEAAAGRILRKLQNDLAKFGGEWVAGSELVRKQRSDDKTAARALLDTLAQVPGIESRPAKQGGRQFRVAS